jgi:hypothetical protein
MRRSWMGRCLDEGIVAREGRQWGHRNCDRDGPPLAAGIRTGCADPALPMACYEPLRFDEPDAPDDEPPDDEPPVEALPLDWPLVEELPVDPLPVDEALPAEAG